MSDQVAIPIEEITALDTYQDETVKTALYPQHCGTLYNLMGGLGEAGEYGKIILKAVDRALQAESKAGGLPTELLVVRQALVRAIDACDELERLKRPIREGKMKLPPIELTEAEEVQAESELGDRAWYLAGDARSIKRRLSQVCQANIRKLRARRAAGVLHGKGETVQQRLENKS